jgi:hypothetical protein
MMSLDGCPQGAAFRPDRANVKHIVDDLSGGACARGDFMGALLPEFDSEKEAVQDGDPLAACMAPPGVVLSPRPSSAPINNSTSSVAHRHKYGAHPALWYLSSLLAHPLLP